MQPAAAEVERTLRVSSRPGPASEPRPRLDQQAVDACLAEPSRGGAAGGAAAHHDDHGVAVCHWPSTPCSTRYRSDRTRGFGASDIPPRPVRIAAVTPD